MPKPNTEEPDIAAFKLVDGSPVTMTSQELFELPEFVVETINIHSVCIFEGVLYGPTEASLKEEPLWVQ